MLQLAASNSRPVTKKLEINLRGEWHATEEKMFTDGIGITEVS